MCLRAELAPQLHNVSREPCKEGAWHHVAIIKDVCDPRVSHKRLFHLDACATCVSNPHGCVVDVQKRLGHRSYTGGCRLCGTFLDPQLEHGAEETQRLRQRAVRRVSNSRTQTQPRKHEDALKRHRGRLTCLPLLETLKWDRELYEFCALVDRWSGCKQDRKLLVTSHHHLDAERVTTRLLESNVGGRPHNHTPGCAERDNLFSVSRFEKSNVVCW